MSTQDSETKRQSAADIVAVIDCSGSMHCMGQEPAQAWNMFLRDQQKVGGEESHVSLYTFNQIVTDVYLNRLLKDAPQYGEYVADGSTALYDAIRLAVKNQLDTGRTKNVVFVIITDGMDNASSGPEDKKFTTSKEEVKSLIKKMEDENNWQVIYLAADQDAFQVGAGYGAKTGKCANFSKARGGLFKAMETASVPVALYRQSSQERLVPAELQLNYQSTEPVTKAERNAVENAHPPLALPRAVRTSSAGSWDMV